MLYEAARAYARNKQNNLAIKTMREYALIAEDSEKEKAAGLVKKLENGETIFSSSNDEKLTFEAKRFFILGQKLFETSQWQGAIDAFEQAYTFAPHPDLLYNIGLAHLKLGHIGDALDFFQEYIKLVPKAENLEQAKQFFLMGAELYNVGQYEAAATRFTMAYSLMPLPEVLFNLALCKKAMGDKKGALSILQELADKSQNIDEQKEIKKMIKQIEK
jgi:TolA-binding protein